MAESEPLPDFEDPALFAKAGEVRAQGQQQQVGTQVAPKET
jgi:hypothetical protein